MAKKKKKKTKSSKSKRGKTKTKSMTTRGSTTIVQVKAPAANPGTRSIGTKAKEYVKRIGLGGWMRRIRLSADGLAGGLGIALKKDTPPITLREKASQAMQRYTAIGFDGAVNLDAAVNNWLGLGTAYFDDWIKRKTRHYQYIGQKHILPTLGEGAPYLFAWDAISDPTLDAREKMQAAYDCFVETTDGYVPSTGQYKGLDSDKFKAYFFGSHLGRWGSKTLNRFLPGIASTIRDLTGWSI